MATKSVIDSKRDYLVSEHGAGRSATDLARQFGVTHKVVRRILGAQYHPIGNFTNLPAPEVISRYAAGESCKTVADSFGVARNVIVRILRNADMPVRGSSEAERLKWSQFTDAQRRKQTAAAHKASKGRKMSFELLCKIAKTRERNMKTVSDHERRLMRMLKDRGVTGVPQVAIGPYNCDIAVGNIAVECWGGQWHRYGLHLRRIDARFRYILNAGWHIVVVIIDGKSALTGNLADYLVSLLEKIGRDPSLIREYWMIWRAPEFVTRGSAKDDKIALVPPFGHSRNPVNGRYETIPR